jgi:hypothetical protein
MDKEDEMKKWSVAYTVNDPPYEGAAFYPADADVDWLAIELGYRAADALRAWQR